MRLADHERLPEFQKRAAALAPELRDKVLCGERLNLGDIARALDVPLDIAGAWLTSRILWPLGETELTITAVDDRGRPQ